MAASPYGSWTSPITSDLVVADSIRLEQVALDGEAIYWSETQPQKQGRTFVYRVGADGEGERVTPKTPMLSAFARARMNMEAGRSPSATGSIYFSNNSRSAALSPGPGRPPRPITPRSRRGRRGCAALRRWNHRSPPRRAWSASGRIIPPRGRGESRRSSPSTFPGALRPRVLVSGNDFYSTPRLSPDGRPTVLALLGVIPTCHGWRPRRGSATFLRTGQSEIRAASRAGGNELVFQPEWSPDGDLYFVSDRGSGWWNLDRERNGAVEPIATMDAEFGRRNGSSACRPTPSSRRPASSHVFVRDGVWVAGRDRGTQLEALRDPIPTPFTDIAQLRAAPGRAVFIGGSPSKAPALRGA